MAQTPKVGKSRDSAVPSRRFGRPPSEEVLLAPVSDTPSFADAVKEWLNVIDFVQRIYNRLPRHYAASLGISYMQYMRLRSGDAASRETVLKIARYFQQMKELSQEKQRGQLPPPGTPNLSDPDVALELAGFDTYPKLLHDAPKLLPDQPDVARWLALTPQWQNSALPEKVDADAVLRSYRSEPEKMLAVADLLQSWVNDVRNGLPEDVVKQYRG